MVVVLVYWVSMVWKGDCCLFWFALVLVFACFLLLFLFICLKQTGLEFTVQTKMTLNF